MIFPSTLFIGNNFKLISDEISNIYQQLGHTSPVNNPDVYQVSDYTIASVRQINRFLSKKPYSHTSKIVYLPDVHLFHLEAQNALLKILEEPGINNYFILTTSQPQKMIPTIISRCQIISLNQNVSISQKIFYPDGRLRDDITDINLFLETQLQLHRQQLINHPSLDQKNTVNKLIKSINMIEANVDPKFALDYFLIS